MSSSSSRRSRFRVRAPDEDPIVAVSDTHEYEADLESMTAKGIKRLCLELMELKKTSDEDFQRNVYLSYSVFVRIFEEIGGVASEILDLKKHASTQTKLIQAVTSNFYANMVISGSKETEVDYPGPSLPVEFGIQMQDSLATLDILLSECRLEEALVVLEKEILTLHKSQIQEGGSSSITMSYAHALSERSIALADQLASMAEHPRVCQPELQMSLSGLCRLGENHRANSILIKFYHSRLRKKVHELPCLKSCLYGTYIREMAKAVFSSISQAAKCFTMLYGETYPYCSELILWTIEETETFSHKFCTYIRSISETSGGLSLAVEAANISISLCSLLKSQRIFLLSNLVDLIRPCMEEVVHTQVEHFKEVIHIFTTTDNWTLGKFFIMGILRDKFSLMGTCEKKECCLLTSSGRKFLTLIQEIVDDISSLVILGMEGSILKGLDDVFGGYMSALERAIPSRENAEIGSPNVSSARTLEQQLSVLVNASTLSRVFPRITGSIFKSTNSSNNILSGQTENFSQNELGDWILSIEEVVDQLCCYFCMQFVSETMSCGDFESTTCFSDWCIPSSSQDPMPSFALQALFVRLRQLERLSESPFVGEDGMIGKLPKEIVEVAIDWLSNNHDFWSKTVESSCIRQCSLLEQVCLDMYFLVVIATLGGYCSDDLLDTAMDLIEEMEAVATKTGSYSYGDLPGGDWAQNSAQLAIKKLLEADDANLEPKLETEAISLELRIQNRENEYPSYVEDSTALVYSESENSVDDDDYDDDGSDGLSEGDDLGELGLERLTIKAEVQPVEYYDDLDEVIENSKLRRQEDIEEKQNIFKKETMAMVNDHEVFIFKGTESKQEPIEEEHTTYPEPKSIDNLQEFDGSVSQPATDENLEIEPEIVEMQRNEDINKLLPDDISQLVLATTSGCSPSHRVVVKKRTKTAVPSLVRNEKCSNESDSKFSSDDLEEKVDDIGENSTPISLKNEEEEKLLLDKLSDLAIETSSKPAGGDNNTSGDLVRRRSGRKRAKSNVDENTVKSGKVAKALGRRWH